MNNRHYVVLTLILITLGVFTFFTLWEYYAEETDLGWRSEARLNPYLAAELLLSRSDYQAYSEDSIDKIVTLDTTNTSTLFLSNSSQILSERRLFDVLDWLEAGGHLIVAAPAPSAQMNDRLLEYFDIGVEKTDYVSSSLEAIIESEFGGKAENTESMSTEERRQLIRDALRQVTDNMNETEHLQRLNEAEQRAYYEQSINLDELTNIRIDGKNEQLRVHFNPAIQLTHPYIDSATVDIPSGYQPFYWRGSNLNNRQLNSDIEEDDARNGKVQANLNITGSDTHLMQFNVGDGLLTVLSDASVFDSTNIDKFEHAYFWQSLINSTNINSVNTTAIIYGTNMPSLLEILQQFAPEVLITSALLLALWIWFSSRRFGPIQNLPTATRRSIAEHIHASASFIWQGGWYGSMLESLCIQINHRAARVIPEFSHSTETEQRQQLSQVSGFEPEQIKLAMTPTNKLSEEGFLKTVRILQQINKSL